MITAARNRIKQMYRLKAAASKAAALLILPPEFAYDP
jgi:hypothetical protein